MSNQRLGFTLVELLIVIVVIAILAAISIIAYNGMQERANDSKVAAAANSYAKAVKMHIADGGVLPQWVGTCLGDPAQYPATGNFQAGECYVETENGIRWEPGYRVGYNSSLASQFDSYITNLPDVDVPAVNFQYANGVGYDTRGLFYNGSSHIIYVLKGDKECPGSDYEEDIAVTYCSIRVK